jgi:non-specific serine/threonine protein kinase
VENAEAAKPLCSLLLSPHGRLVLAVGGGIWPLEKVLAQRLREAFERGSGTGLLHLSARETGTTLPAEFAYWRDFGARFMGRVCALPEGRDQWDVSPLGEAECEDLLREVPLMTGAEYLDHEVLGQLWLELEAAFKAAWQAVGGPLQGFLSTLNPAWNLVGRVHFNLAENRKDEACPFAFLATYTTSLSAQAKAQHLPLGRAMQEYATQKDRLLSLLLPLQRACERLPWLKRLVDAGEIFHPLRWTPVEALTLLQDVEKLERAGIQVRLPAAWNGKRPPRPRVTASVGAKAPAALGMRALLDFNLGVSLEGEPLTEEEILQLMAANSGLVLLRGQWIEVDASRMAAMLDRFRQAQAMAREGISFGEALRLLAGADLTLGAAEAGTDTQWSEVVAGPWLAETLKRLRHPEGLAQVHPGPALRGTLRPYQATGVQWLHLLSQLGLGACLADDMGLGKTIQVIALLLVRSQQSSKRMSSLLVAPASLLANWASELQRFAPELTFTIAHPSGLGAAELKTLPERLGAFDLVITSYGTLLRQAWLSEPKWGLVILDEAQAIKNPGTRQTKAVKGLKAGARIALTGTPVENRMGDLWSLFDFLNPGLLGSGAAFTDYAKRMAAQPHHGYGPLRDLIRPYILRRLKTDRSIIQDLPDKVEVRAFCPLSKRQAALYQEAVAELTHALETTSGIQRKGLVLSALMRFKQICNHPSQWLGDGAWAEGDSGKWERLRDLGGTIAARQEKVLVFTQFREVTAPLAAHLAAVFGRPGLVLTGATPVKHRKELVSRFQEDEEVPFFILSLKAGGSGLNLTAASHVIHFDRWWNPAVENQATDRAFRIGQKKNVMVHKFVCRGTVEEKIDALIESKRALSSELLEGDAEILLTELSDAELLKLVSLDLAAALED